VPKISNEMLQSVSIKGYWFNIFCRSDEKLTIDLCDYI
jgi:hypothetical protein